MSLGIEVDPAVFEVRVRYWIRLEDGTSFELVTDLFDSKVFELPEAAKEFEGYKAFSILDKYRERGAHLFRFNNVSEEWLDVTDRWCVRAVPVSDEERKSYSDTRKDSKWIETNAEAYRGQWVALRNGELLANAPTRKELGELMDARGDRRGSLFFHFGDWFFGDAPCLP
jgi:hypothetical protein